MRFTKMQGAGNDYDYIDCFNHRLPAPEAEGHPACPRRANVEFVRGLGPDDVTVRVWERGSGETLACGTGACAVAGAGVLTGRTRRRLVVRLPGGDLQLHWSEADN